MHAAHGNVQEVTRTSQRPAAAVIELDGAGRDEERLGERPVEVRFRTASARRHVPFEQAELPVGRRSGRHEPRMHTGCREGETVHLVADTEPGADFAGRSQVGHLTDHTPTAWRQA